MTLFQIKKYKDLLKESKFPMLPILLYLVKGGVKVTNKTFVFFSLMCGMPAPTAESQQPEAWPARINLRETADLNVVFTRIS